MGARQYLLSGSMPPDGGAISLERSQFLGEVKTPISLRATFSWWNSAVSESRVMVDSMCLT